MVHFLKSKNVWICILDCYNVELNTGTLPDLGWPSIVDLYWNFISTGKILE